MPSDHHQIYQLFVADSGLCRKRLGSWNQLFSEGLVRRMKAHLENEAFQHVPQQVSCHRTCWWHVTWSLLIHLASEGAANLTFGSSCHIQNEQQKKAWWRSMQKKTEKLNDYVICGSLSWLPILFSDSTTFNLRSSSKRCMWCGELPTVDTVLRVTTLWPNKFKAQRGPHGGNVLQEYQWNTYETQWNTVWLVTSFLSCF